MQTILIGGVPRVLCSVPSMTTAIEDWAKPRCFKTVLRYKLLRVKSSSIGHMCANFSAIADDKLVTLTSLVKMWKPQQKGHCVLWLTEFQAVTRVLRRIRTEWHAVLGLPNRLINTPTK
ncbi:uncharacterized protein TNCV_1939661 [Trichonephila clavipes]|nr:uncharacterized protein TNCV_1939661 [Trichonephila clavipes]